MTDVLFTGSLSLYELTFCIHLFIVLLTDMANKLFSLSLCLLIADMRAEASSVQCTAR